MTASYGIHYRFTDGGGRVIYFETDIDVSREHLNKHDNEIRGIERGFRDVLELDGIENINTEIILNQGRITVEIRNGRWSGEITSDEEKIVIEVIERNLSAVFCGGEELFRNGHRNS